MLWNGEQLNDVGLNMQAVVDISTLPESLAESVLAGLHEFNKADATQLILIGHGGKAFWQALTRRNLVPDHLQIAGASSRHHPMDRFTIDVLKAWFAAEHPDSRYEILYPSSSTVSLQQIGQWVGWHHESPLRLGINEVWGLWFAYRALLVSDTRFPCFSTIAPGKTVSLGSVSNVSPCVNCVEKPCIAECPVAAVSEQALDIDACVKHRSRHESSCAKQCIARSCCPVRQEHQYDTEQMTYHYTQSLAMIREMN